MSYTIIVSYLSSFKYSNLRWACLGLIMASFTPSLAFAQQADVKIANFTDALASLPTDSTSKKLNFEADVVPILPFLPPL